MSNKHIMNAGICCICTAVIFGLHFFVYGRMLLDNPVLVGATCAVFIASAAGRTGEEREPWFPPNHIVTRLCQLIWCAALGTIPYVLCIDPYSLDNWIVCSDRYRTGTSRGQLGGLFHCYGARSVRYQRVPAGRTPDYGIAGTEYCRAGRLYRLRLLQGGCGRQSCLRRWTTGRSDYLCSVAGVG